MQGDSGYYVPVGTTVHRCRWMPCPTAIVTGAEPATAVTFVALGVWDEDSQRHGVSVGYLAHPVDQSTPPTFNTSAYGYHTVLPGAVTDLQVGRVGDYVVVAAGTATGVICCMRSQWPGCSGILETDEVPTAVDNVMFAAPVVSNSQAPVTGVDVNPAAPVVLGVTSNGSAALMHLDRGADLDVTEPFKAASPWSGFAVARWLDASTFVTAGMPGGLSCWDVRKGPTPVVTTPRAHGHTGYPALDAAGGVSRQLTCLAAHPSRAWAVASGSSGGGVALWDLRRGAAPLVQRRPDGDCVLEVAFDPLDAGPNSQGPAVLYCTAGGRLCRASLNSSSDAGAGLSSGDVLVEEPYGIASFDPAPVVGTRSSGLLVALAGEQVCLVPQDTEPQVGGW